MDITRKLLVVATVILLTLPFAFYSIPKVKAEPAADFSIIAYSKYPYPDNSTTWLSSTEPLYTDAWTGNPVYDSDTFTVKLTSIDGFTGSVTLSINDPSSLPLSYTFATNPVTLPANGVITTTLTITATGSINPGTYTVYIVATSGSITKSTPITIVSKAPDVMFRFQNYPYVVSTIRGSTIVIPILAISQSGFEGSVMFSILSGGSPVTQPTGFTVDFLTPTPSNGAAFTLLPHEYAVAKVRIQVGTTASYGAQYPTIRAIVTNNMLINGLDTSYDGYLYELVSGSPVPMFWSYTPGTLLYDTSIYFSSPSSLRLGSATSNAFAAINVKIPITGPSNTLTFYYRDQLTNTGDTFSYAIVDHSTTPATIVATAALPESTSFTLVSVPIPPAYRGKTLNVQFGIGYDTANPVRRIVNIDSISFTGYYGTLTSTFTTISIPVNVVDLNIVFKNPSYTIQPPLAPQGDFEAYTIGPRPPNSLYTVTTTTPNPYPTASTPGVWQGKAITLSGYTPTTYQWSVDAVGAGSPSSYDSVYAGSRALRIGATPDYPTAGFYHIWGWEVARFGPINIPSGPLSLVLSFYMYVDSQEGSASSADFWDPFYFTVRTSDSLTNPYVSSYIPSDSSVVYYIQISSTSSWGTWSLITITLPDSLKGLSNVFISFEQGHRDPLFRTWRIIDNVRFGFGGAGLLTDLTVLAGSKLTYNGYIEQTSTTGNYLGSVSLSATISPPISYTPRLLPIYSGNLIKNGNFETGDLMGWDYHEDLQDGIPNVDVVYIINNPNVLEGRYSARIHETCTTALCQIIGLGYTTLSTVSPVYLDPNATSPYLTFQYKFTGSSLDWFDSFVEIIDADSNRVLASQFISWTSSPTTINIDLTPYRGLNIIIRFNVAFYVPLFDPNSAFYLDRVGVYSLTTEAPNMISNGDFELGSFAFWSISTVGGASVTLGDFVSDSNVISGRYSALIKVPTPTASASLRTTTTFMVPVTSVNPYFTFKYKITSGSIIAIIWSTFPVTAIAWSKVYTGSGQDRVDLSSLKHPLASYYVEFYSATANTVAYIDDVGVYTPEQPGSSIAIIYTNQRYNFYTDVKIPQNTQAGIYTLTLTFTAPLYSPAVESGPSSIVKSFPFRIRVIGVSPSATQTLAPDSGSSEFAMLSSDELPIKVTFTVTGIPTMLLNFDSYDVWVSSTSPDSPVFTPYDGSSAARYFGIWLDYPQQATRVGRINLPGIANGDFEDGLLAPWSTSGNIALDSANPISGSYSALITGNPGGQITSDVFRIPSNLTNPVLSFTYKTTVSSFIGSITFQLISGSNVVLSRTLSPSTNVTTVNIDLSNYKSDAAVYQVVFILNTADPNVGLYIDDVFLSYSTTATFKVVTQLAQTGKYMFWWYATNNITGLHAIPSLLTAVNPPPNQWLYRTFVGLPVNFFNVTVGDASVTTDTYSIATSAGGSASFNIVVNSVALSYGVSFTGSAYYIFLDRVTSVPGISFSFSPSTVSLGADSRSTVQVVVNVGSNVPPGQYYIDIVAKFVHGNLVTTRTISGIKVFVTPQSLGGISIENRIVAMPENEVVAKKIPTYQYSNKPSSDNVIDKAKPINPIGLLNDNVKNKEVYIAASNPAMSFIVPILTTILAIGVAIYLTRKFI